LSLSLDAQLSYLRLARAQKIGPVTFQRLMRLYGDGAKALDALPELSSRGGRKRPLKAYPLAKAKQEYSDTQKLGGHYLIWGTPEYPSALAALPDAPPVIAAHGHVHLLQKPMVAMVGARNASAAARKLTAQIAGDLSANGIVVVSGLARGVDGAAHQAALSHGTIAVLGNGAAHAYPRENIELMGPVPMGVDELIEQSQMPVPQVHLVLLELDLAGRLTQEAGGKICLLKPYRQTRDLTDGLILTI